MVKVIIDVDDSQYNSISEKLPQIKERGLKLTGQDMLRNLGLNSPVDHGLLRQWFFASTSPEQIEIRTPAKYAIFPNDGTGIYNGGSIIKPKSGKALRFKPGPKWKGPVNEEGYAFLKYSKGQKGQHFVEKSIKQTQGKIQDIFLKTISEVVK